MATPLRFDDLELDIMMTADGTFVGSIEGKRLVDQGFGGRVALAAIGDIDARDIRLDVTTDDFSLAGLGPFIPGLPAVVVDAGKLSGNANLRFAAGGLEEANIDMVALGGSLDLTMAGLPELDYDTASVIMEYQAPAGRLSLAQGELALADGRTVSLSGDDALHSAAPTPSVRGSRWPINQIYADWPAVLVHISRRNSQSGFPAVISRLHPRGCRRHRPRRLAARDCLLICARSFTACLWMSGLASISALSVSPMAVLNLALAPAVWSKNCP